MTKNQQLKEKIAEIIIKHLGVCDKESPEEILRLFKEEVKEDEKDEKCQHKWVLVKHTVEWGNECVYLYCERCGKYIYRKVESY